MTFKVKADSVDFHGLDTSKIQIFSEKQPTKVIFSYILLKFTRKDDWFANILAFYPAIYRMLMLDCRQVSCS